VSSAQGWLLQVLVALAPALAADDGAPTRVDVGMMLAEQAARAESVSAATTAPVIEAARLGVALGPLAVEALPECEVRIARSLLRVCGTPSFCAGAQQSGSLRVSGLPAGTGGVNREIPVL
jgi:hypothetical protein